jgi:ADP-L-glycero-D-manno-heptose 6-epimerase
MAGDMTEKYVVTGGAGFIGSNIVAALEARGCEVVVIDIPDAGKAPNLAKRRVQDIIAPDRTLAALEALGGKVRCVVHMGAISDTTVMDTERMMESNFHFPCRLWNWCAARKVPFVYASSAATYGDGAAGFEDRQDEAYLARLMPLNAYGMSKHLFDRWACGQGMDAPPRWAGLKFFNVFGPNEYHKGAMRSVALQLFEQIERDGVARLFKSDCADYADGGQMRDFVWVGDCVEAVLWLLDGARTNGLYNLGSGRARSFADLARAMFAEMDKPEAIEFIAMPEALKGRYQYFTQALMQKLPAAGYPHRMTALEEGVRQYVRGYLGRPDRYR